MCITCLAGEKNYYFIDDMKMMIWGLVYVVAFQLI